MSDTTSDQSLLIPEPPRSDSGSSPPIIAHRLDFVKLGLPEYRNKYVNATRVGPAWSDPTCQVRARHRQFIHTRGLSTVPIDCGSFRTVGTGFIERQRRR